MPMTATTMPRATPMMVAATEMIRVLRRPTPRSWGRTSAIAPKSKKVRMMVLSQSIVALRRR